MWLPARASSTFKRWAGLWYQLGALYLTPNRCLSGDWVDIRQWMDGSGSSQLVPMHTACGRIIVGSS